MKIKFAFINLFWPVLRLLPIWPDPRFAWDTVVAPGATFDPLVGWQYRYAPFPGVISVYTHTFVAAVDAGSPVVLLATSGSDTIQQESPIQSEAIATSKSELPRPDEVVPLTDAVAAGDLIALVHRNTDVANRRVAGFIDIQPS